MRVTYFAHDLADTAVARRVRMLRLGGAEVRLLGFRRGVDPVTEVEGIATGDLGRTFDGQLLRRCAQVVHRCVAPYNWRAWVGDADVVLARNLEMATMADAVRRRLGSPVRLAYECLDIHGALVNQGVAASLLRNWERQVLRRSDTLVVSSAGFLTHHFAQLGIALPDVVVAENKRLLADGGTARPAVCRESRSAPWRIGWFGGLRCVDSFHILHDVASSYPHLVDIELRGRPTRDVQTLITQHLPLNNMRFAGAFAQTDLAALYATCDITWAIDYFFRDRNSAWLLPNRLYESGFYNCPIIAQANTETARWLQARGTGIVLDDPAVDLVPFLLGLTTAAYQTMRHAAAAVPTADLAWTSQDCQWFVRRIAGASLTMQGRPATKLRHDGGNRP